MEEKLNDLHEINPEQLIKNITEKESKNIYLTENESIILDIISFINDSKSKIKDKTLIIKYLTKCLINFPINVEILLTPKLKEKCLYHIIIYEYIINYQQKEYTEELKNLLSEILKNIGYDKFMYQYIISFIADYFNKKSLLSNEDAKNKENIEFNEKIKFNDFNSCHLMAVLELIHIFYEQGNKIIEPNNYFYFLGEENDNIIINNEPQLIDSKHDNYILLFIKLLDKQYFDNFSFFSLLEIKINNSTSININIILEKEIQNKENNCIYIPYDSFKVNEVNQVLIKISKNKNIQILINNTVQKTEEASI